MMISNAGPKIPLRCIFAALMTWSSTLATVATEAIAQAPDDITIGTAPAISPSIAFGIYGSSDVHTDDLGLARAPEIRAAARALKHDPDLIYEFVRNKVNITPMFGLQKGALGALLDWHGTAFDQAHLMVELLRESGIGARYKVGTVTLNRVQFSDWLGVADARAACRLLADGGIPAIVNGSTDCASLAGDLSTVTMAHIWVEATIDAESFLFDPAYKAHEKYSGMDIAAEAGFSGAPAFIAMAGGLMGSDNNVAFIRNIDWNGIHSSLRNMGLALLEELRTFSRAMSMDEVIGARRILETTIPEGGLRETSLPYPASVVTTLAGDIPDQYRTRFTVAIDAFNLVVEHRFFVDEIYGRRMEIVPDLDQARWQTPMTQDFNWRLKVDGMTVATHTSLLPPNGRGMHLGLSADHPYVALGGTYMDESTTKIVTAHFPATIVHAWGVAGDSLLGKLSGEMPGEQTFTEPLTTGPDPVEPQALVVTRFATADTTLQKLAAGWSEQMSRMAELQGDIAGARILHHHSIGAAYTQMKVGQNNFFLTESYFFPLQQMIRLDIDSAISVISDSGSDTDARAVAQSFAAFAAALEASIPEQQLDARDVASTAERFVWGQRNFADTLKFYHFKPGDAAAVSDMILLEGTPNCFEHSVSPEPCAKPPHLEFRANVGSLLNYLASGYEVIAANDAFLGPGAAFGPRRPENPSTFDPALARGMAYVAFKPDGTGIAHIVNDTNLDTKGGGAADDPVDAFDAGKAADILKDEFEDRSVRHGVDLATGSLSWTTPTMLSVGTGDFPYMLGASWSFRPGFDEESNWKSNWEMRANYSGSGLEAMGASDKRAGVASLVAFMVAQELARQGSALDNLVLLPFVAQWWADEINHNVISVSSGGTGEQYVRLVDGSFLPTAGGSAVLVETGQPRLERKHCPIDNIDCTDPVMAPSGPAEWKYDTARFEIRLGDGSVQFFEPLCHVFHPENTSATPTEDIEACELWIDRQVMPSGFTVSFGYDLLGERNSPRLRSVSNDHGRRLTFTGAKSATRVASDTRHAEPTGTAGGDSFAFEFAGPDDMAADARPFNGPRLARIFEPHDLQVPALEVFYEADGTIAHVKDAQALADAAAAVAVPRPATAFHVLPGHRGERVDPLGHAFTVYRDREGRAVQFLDELGRVVSQSHDAFGRVVERVFPEGNRSRFAYDDRDNVVAFTRVPKPGSGLAPVTATAVWHAEFDSPVSVTDFEGRETTLVYGESGGSRGRVVRVEQPAVVDGVSGQTARPVFVFGWNGDGQQVSMTDPTGVVTTTAYYSAADGDGTLRGYPRSRTVDPGGLDLTTRLVFDAVGNLTAATDPRGDAPVFVPEGQECVETGVVEIFPGEFAPGCVAYATVPGHWLADGAFSSRMTWDADRREVLLDPPGDGKTRRVYEGGRLVRVERLDDAGAVLETTEMTYTPTGRELCVTSPDGAVSCNGYDAADRLVESVDPEGRVTRFDLDAAGQVLREIRAFGTALEQVYAAFSYTLSGRQASVMDANCNVTGFAYDGHDRLVRQDFPGKAALGVSCPGENRPDGTDFEAFTHDANGNVLSKRTRKGDVIASAYDALGRVISKSPGADKAVTFAYDLAGRQTGARYADGSYIIAQS